MIAEKAFPVIKPLYENQGNAIENIVVPFADGMRQVQVVVGLQKAYETNCLEIVSGFERTVSLALIDDAWKEHLREMDELKTSVQNAVYEQKDPLLIYKFESFELFKKMVESVNRDVLAFLYKGFIAAQDSGSVKEARAPQRTDHSKLKTSHDEAPAAAATGGRPQAPQAPRPQAPVRAEPKVGRNDPCPCGSGKKFKSCHGINAEA
jgi:preprotein translocase subunit SecA